MAHQAADPGITQTLHHCSWSKCTSATLFSVVSTVSWCLHRQGPFVLGTRIQLPACIARRAAPINHLSMNSLKNDSLQRLALHCGYRTETTKAARLQAIASSAAFSNKLLAIPRPKTSPLRILSVDVGIKHFSYSKVAYSANTAHLHEWNVCNLHDRFGVSDYSGFDSLVDSKAYLASLALGVVDDIFLSPDWTPHIITVENQRTRSNNNKATLPNVLLNFSLEQMMYAVFAARQSSNKNIAASVVIPMNSNKMVNFWFSRFLAPLSKVSSAQSKVHRTNLLYGWLLDKGSAPFELASPIHTLPVDFGSLSSTKKKAALRGALSLAENITKVDDLVDSLLYNFTLAKQLVRHEQLLKAGEDAIPLLLKLWDRHHQDYLSPLIESTNLNFEFKL